MGRTISPGESEAALIKIGVLGLMGQESTT